MPERYSPESLDEQEQKRWSQVELFSIQTGDQDNLPGPGSKEELDIILDSARVFLDALSRPETHDRAARLFGEPTLNFFDLSRIQAWHKTFTDPRVIQRLIFYVQSPPIDPLRCTLGLGGRYPQGKFSYFFGNTDGKLNKTEIGRQLERSDRAYFLSISDSHRTTADMMRALKNTRWEYDRKKTAILAIDHHSDTYPFRTIPEPVGKATVMRWLLEQGLVGKVGVFGTQYIEDDERMNHASFFEGSSFYDERGSPKQMRFEQAVEGLFQGWRDAGIRSIYLSIDLDGLRLDELGYTGTDYGIERGRLEAATVFAEADRLLRQTNTYHLETAEQLRQTLWNTPTTSDAYHGIPARWLVTIFQKMRDPRFQFTLGLQDARTGKRVIGDIVELSGPDHKRHTERIAQALARTFVRQAVTL